MSILDKLELLYPSVSANVLSLLLDNATAFAADYCNIEEVPESMEPLLIKMVQEDVNRLYAEGFSAESAGGNSISYETDYTTDIYKRLNQHKRIRTI